MLFYVYFMNLQKSALSFIMVPIETIFIFRLSAQRVFAGCFQGTLKDLVQVTVILFLLKCKLFE